MYVHIYIYKHTCVYIYIYIYTRMYKQISRWPRPAGTGAERFPFAPNRRDEALLGRGDGCESYLRTNLSGRPW